MPLLIVIPFIAYPLGLIPILRKIIFPLFVSYDILQPQPPSIKLSSEGFLLIGSGAIVIPSNIIEEPGQSINKFLPVISFILSRLLTFSIPRKSIFFPYMGLCLRILEVELIFYSYSFKRNRIFKNLVLGKYIIFFLLNQDMPWPDPRIHRSC